jgi:lysozyme family protein
VAVTAIIDGILEREGSAFTNDPADSGGPTRYGITLATLDAYYRKHIGRRATVDDVRGLIRTVAFDIYAERYIREPRFHQVADMDPRIGEELVDTGVNCGVVTATMSLQRCLNALNLNATKYPDIEVDGKIGPRTLDALRSYFDWRGDEGRRVLLVALNCLQGERYIDLAEKRPKDERFLYGWLRTRIT